MATKAKTLIIKSPLKAWPGKIELPLPDDFSGVHWLTWKDSVNQPRRKNYALTHLYCYSGLELIQAAGEWDIAIPLSEVQTWETAPDEERIKLVAWLGRTMMRYMDDIMDPKE
jgi:hypothetical protein